MRAELTMTYQGLDAYAPGDGVRIAGSHMCLSVPDDGTPVSITVGRATCCLVVDANALVQLDAGAFDSRAAMLVTPDAPFVFHPTVETTLHIAKEPTPPPERYRYQAFVDAIWKLLVEVPAEDREELVRRVLGDLTDNAEGYEEYGE